MDLTKEEKDTTVFVFETHQNEGDPELGLKKNKIKKKVDGGRVKNVLNSADLYFLCTMYYTDVF